MRSAQGKLPRPLFFLHVKSAQNVPNNEAVAAVEYNRREGGNRAAAPGLLYPTCASNKNVVFKDNFGGHANQGVGPKHPFKSMSWYRESKTSVANWVAVYRACRLKLRAQLMHFWCTMFLSPSFVSHSVYINGRKCYNWELEWIYKRAVWWRYSIVYKRQ